jgi:hypothetical protein
MAVFEHSGSGTLAFVSFKALYSRFTAASEWTEVSVDPTPRMLIKALISGRLTKTFHLLRCPYRRTVSCFMDKYRKQPQRIDQQGFTWQNCHSILYSSLGIGADAANEEISTRFLAFTFDDFIDMLPEIYHLDGHFKPQSWSNRLLIRGRNSIPWPFSKRIKVEDAKALLQIPGIDFSVKTNTTGHLDRDFELTDRHRRIIYQLYRKDFELGGYPTE